MQCRPSHPLWADGETRSEIPTVHPPAPGTAWDSLSVRRWLGEGRSGGLLSSGAHSWFGVCFTVLDFERAAYCVQQRIFFLKICFV